MSGWGKAEATVPTGVNSAVRKSKKKDFIVGGATLESAEASLLTPAPTSAPTSAPPSPSSASRSVDSTTLACSVKDAGSVVPNVAPSSAPGPVVSNSTTTTPSRSRPPKDPNAPKRPPSSFILYVNAERARVQAENPDLSYLETTRLLCQLWEKADKKKWEDEVAKLFDDYRKDMETYGRKVEGEAQLIQPPIVTNTCETLLDAADKATVDEANATPRSDKPKKKKKSKKGLDEGPDSTLTTLDAAATPTAILSKETPFVPPNAVAHLEKGKDVEGSPVAGTNLSMSIEISPNPNITLTSSTTTGGEKRKSPKKANRTKRDAPEPISSSALLTSDSEYVGEKGPLVAVPHPSALSSSQLLFGTSSSQQSAGGLDLSQTTTAVTGVETTPEAPKIKRKKRDKSQGSQAAPTLQQQ